MNKEFFDKEFMPKMNRIGKITGALGVIVSFIPALVLAVVYGILPNWGALAVAFVAGASSFAVMWFVEPISYYPVLGPIGTYMAFLSGNISNMRVPCSSMAIDSAGVQPGSAQGTIIATLGMAVSIVINTAVLTVGVILGSSVLALLPASVKDALNYLLPALFGALTVQFGLKAKSQAVIVLAFAVILNFGLKAGVFAWLPGANNFLGTLSSVVVSLVVGLTMLSRSKKA